MDNTRRNFFKNLCTTSVFLGVGSKLDATTGLVHDEHEFGPAEFPLIAKTKYYFPPEKSPLDVKQDLDSWGDIKKFTEIYNQLVAEKKVSLIMKSSYKKDHLESRMFFKDIDSYKEFIDYLAKNQVVNHQKQKELGYTVIVEVT